MGLCSSGLNQRKKAEMVDRKFYKKEHFIALMITLVIFVIGILIGLKVSDLRVGYVQDISRVQKADLESLQLQYLFLNTQKNKNESCVVLQKTLDQSLHDLENARLKIETYIQNLQREDFILTKKEYMLNEIRYWLLAQQMKQECGADVVSILYFYAKDENCGDCSTQGYILTSLKNRFEDKLLIFSLDSEFDESMIKILNNVYNITRVPALIIESKKFEGLITKEKLSEIICKNYKNNLEECEEFK